MQAYISQNLGYMRNEMILEESLYECEVGRLLNQYRARRAARFGRWQGILTSLFGWNNTSRTQVAVTPKANKHIR